MALTPEQREQRRNHGASDVAAILGKDPWKSAADVYLSKVEQLADNPNPAMVMGSKLERSVIEWAQEQLGKELVTDVFNVAPGGVMAANHDALVKAEPEGVEAKTACIMHYSADIADQWGDAGSDNVPAHVVLQCQAQMHVSDLQLVWVPCLIGGRGFQMYRVERNERLIAAIVAECTRFWTEHVLARIPPNGSAPSLDIVKLIKRQPNKVVPINSESITNWQRAKELAKEYYDQAEQALAVVLAELGDAEAGDCELGRLTYLTQTRKEHVVHESMFRKPYFKKAKS